MLYKQCYSIQEKENAEATFFIDGNWLEKNRNKFLELIDHQYTIGNYSYQGNYQHESFVWVDTIIKKVGGQKNSYCLVFDEDEKAINICKLQKCYENNKKKITNGNCPNW